jgi:hypothetical protein
MRKSLILVLITIGSSASYAAGVPEAAEGPAADDPATWRWQVSAILTEQSVTVSRPAADLTSFDQGYERYSAFGLREPLRDQSR